MNSDDVTANINNAKRHHVQELGDVEKSLLSQGNITMMTLDNEI
jgi:hypothetical protein